MERSKKLSRIAITEFSDIVVRIEITDRLRIHLIDGSFLDVWFSRSIPGKYAYHWESRHVSGEVFRWDNAAHRKWRHIRTYPHHCHYGRKDNVKEFSPEKTDENTLRKIMKFIRKRLQQ